MYGWYSVPNVRIYWYIQVVRMFVRNHKVARLYSGRVDLLFLFSRFPPMQNRFGGI